MASFTVDAELVCSTLRATPDLDDLDDDMIEYLSGAIAECDEPGEAGVGVVELLTPFLESYDVVDDVEEAEKLARKLVDDIIACDALCFKSATIREAELVELENRRLAMMAQASQLEAAAAAADAAGNAETWGLNDVKNKKITNTIVDSISDALGDKKSLERHNKKLEKERLKEEAKFEREEAARVADMQSLDAAPPTEAPTGNKMSVNLRNRSSDVHIENINISVGAGRPLLEDAELKIVQGRKYGLIGKNGTGKTTLLKSISRRQLEGFPPYLTVVHVEQEVTGDDTRVVDYVLEADKELQALLTEEKRLMTLAESGSASDTDTEALRKCYDDMAAIGAESAEARARMVLTGLGFTESMQSAPTKSLSGGWRMRVALATALFQNPDILLLDEPTNHLDVTSVLFLEHYLQSYNKAFILVSHDRVFTDNVITDVIHLENRKLTYYKGDIGIFEQTRENQRLQQQREFESQQLKRAHMQKFVDKFRYNAKRASLAQSRIKALNRMTLVEDVLDDPEFTFSFPEPISELGKVIEVQEASFGYPTGEDGKGPPENVLFEKADFSIFATSRMVLLGANGCGKSTLLKVIMDKLKPTEGYVQREPKLRIGYFSQHHVDQLNTRLSPLDYLLETFHGSKPDDVRAHLSRYGIPAELALQRIGTLSGGQKSRVAFAKITWDRPHLLIADEPSNHLDLETNSALAIAINTFEGGVLLVTHDQFLIEMCAETFWVMQDKKVFQFQGTFKEYKAWAFAQMDAKNKA